MKRITILMGVLLFAGSAYAQFDKGRMLVGGSFGADFSTNKSKYDGNTYTNSKYASVSFDPQFGIFVIDNLAVGGALGMSSSTWKDDDTNYKSISHEITIEPMVRYYIQPGVFFQGRFIAGTSKDKTTDDGTTDETKYGVTGWALSVGYAMFLNDIVAIEPQLGYGAKGYKNKDSDVKSIDSGLFLRVGFQIYLR